MRYQFASIEELDELRGILARVARHRDELLEALRGCHRAMEMQEKRMSGEFHLSAGAFTPLWESAREEAERLLVSKTAPATEGGSK